MRLFSLLAAGLVIVLIAGCKTAPPSNAAAGGSTPQSQQGQTKQAPSSSATKAASTKANLAVEKLRLAELFRGTPVLFALQPDGSMRAEVPLHFSFDTGKALVKAPLAAVLDRIAAGQLHEATKLVITAPADVSANGAAALVGARGASVRDYLVAHGLSDARVAMAGPSGTAVVRIVVTDMPAL